MGVIDTLSAGFGLVNRRPWLLLLPLVLDLFLWYGPALTMQPLTREIARTYSTFLQRQRETLLQNGITESDLQQVQTEVTDAMESLGQFNLLHLLSVQLPTLAWNLQLNNLGEDEPRSGQRSGAPVWQVRSGWVALALLVILPLGGLLLSALYYQLVAAAAQAWTAGKRSPPFGLLVLVNWARFVAFWLLVGLVVGSLALFVLLIAGLMAAALPALAIAALTGLSILWFWLAVMLFFAHDAMVVNNVGPLRAAWYSYNIVGRNFWAVLPLIGLLLLIGVGVPLALRPLLQWELALPAGLVVHAYIQTGLTAAHLLFYRERYQMWQAPASRRPTVMA